MLNPWEAERKLIYSFIFIGIAIVVIGIPAFFIFYTPPNCEDGKKNRDETGVDCGGSCRNLCQAAELPPVVVWAHKFMVTPTVYSVVAYIENPNAAAEARSVPYTFRLLNELGEPIAERSGTAFIPAHKKFAIFEGGINVGDVKPGRVEFEFTKPAYWSRVLKPEPRLVISNQILKSSDVKPRIDAEISNPTINPITNISVGAIVYGGDGNAIAASETYVERLERDETAPLVFTWPSPYPTQFVSCEIPTDVMLVLDRSGSMNDDGASPAQPLTDAKNAAASFVDRLKTTDQVGVVSFASNASNPIDAILTSDLAKVKNVISKLSILQPENSQNTNIGDGIKKADEELLSSRKKDGATKVIVVLTDGEPTEPEKAGDPKYPEKYALSAAAEARDHGHEIYTIGLGNQVNTTFLSQVATGPDYFYMAATGKELNTIYKNIATAICKKGTTKIELIPIVEPR
jgi:Mg-chelatase subunit ChlD